MVYQRQPMRVLCIQDGRKNCWHSPDLRPGWQLRRPRSWNFARLSWTRHLQQTDKPYHKRRQGKWRPCRIPASQRSWFKCLCQSRYAEGFGHQGPGEDVTSYKLLVTRLRHFDFLVPAHHGAKFTANLFNLVFGFDTAA